MIQDIGTIKMRMFSGKPSAITVSRRETGAVDIHISRSSEGEALIMLPRHTARQLGELLLKAAQIPEHE